MELRLPLVQGCARRLATLPTADPVVGRGERRLPAVVPAQRFARHPGSDRILPGPAPARGQGHSAPSRAAHGRRAGSHARSAAAAGGW